LHRQGPPLLAAGGHGRADPDVHPVRRDDGRARGARRGRAEERPRAVIEWRDDEGPVVAVFAHPDDAEISSGGTLAKWSAEGRDVHLVVLTNGDRGSEEPDCDREALARTRAEEQKRAAKVL